jgi:hypothetical protein
MSTTGELDVGGEPLGSLPRALKRPGLDAIVAACAAAVLGLVLAVATETTLLGLASDDAFYYFKIAESIVVGAGSTFDGIAPTNGYHPLWMVCAVAVYALGGATGLGPAAALIWLGGALGLWTAVLARRLVEGWIAPGFGLVALALLLLPHGVIAMLNGLETSLALLTTCAVIAFVARRDALDPSRPLADAAWLGALLACAFLARLDSIFLAFAAGGLTLLTGALGRAPWGRVLARCAVMGGAFLALASPYLALNLWSFGALMPISGAVKSSMPALRHSLVLEGDSLFGLALLCASWLALIPVVARDVRTRSVAEALRSPLLLLALACSGHFLHVFFWMDWGVYWWHFAAYGLLLALAVPAGLSRLLAPGARRLAIAGALGLSLLTLPIQVGQIDNRLARHVMWRDAALWARQNTEPDAVFALKDAGLFAFFSERAVVNLDGKANGLRYRDHLASGEVERYLREVGVRYVADVNGGCASDGRCAIQILRSNRPGVFLVFPAADELYRSASYPTRLGLQQDGPEPRFMIWRFDPDAGGAAR